MSRRRLLATPPQRAPGTPPATTCSGDRSTHPPAAIHPPRASRDPLPPGVSRSASPGGGRQRVTLTSRLRSPLWRPSATAPAPLPPAAPLLGRCRPPPRAAAQPRLAYRRRPAPAGRAAAWAAPAAPPRCGAAAAALLPPPHFRRRSGCSGSTAAAPLHSHCSRWSVCCGGVPAAAPLSSSRYRRWGHCCDAVTAIPPPQPRAPWRPLSRRHRPPPRAAALRRLVYRRCPAPAGGVAARVTPPPPVPRTVARPRLLRRPHSSPAGAAADVYVELFPLRLQSSCPCDVTVVRLPVRPGDVPAGGFAVAAGPPAAPPHRVAGLLPRRPWTTCLRVPQLQAPWVFLLPAHSSTSRASSKRRVSRCRSAPMETCCSP